MEPKAEALPVPRVVEFEFNTLYQILVVTRQFAAAEALLNWQLAQLNK